MAVTVSVPIGALVAEHNPVPPDRGAMHIVDAPIVNTIVPVGTVAPDIGVTVPE